MPAKRGTELRARKGRSDAQQQGSAAMILVMQAWEALSDEERLTWDVAGKCRRMKGIDFFKQVNLRRLRRGDELTSLPLQFRPHDGRPLIKRLHIGNRDGRITLKLELRRVPDAPTTVWGSLPCNLGLKQPRKCPRLGWLPVRPNGWCEITDLYFAKHGERIQEHRLQVVGKRIFIRIRQEVDDGVPLYEQIKAVVPASERQKAKKGLSPSKDLRIPFEVPSKALRTVTRTPRSQHAMREP